MKRILLLAFLINCIGATAQEFSYTDLLKNVDEVTVTDSFHIESAPQQLIPIDSITMKKWFGPLLGLTKNNRLKNRSYYLTGKITSNENFDMLVVLEEKKKSDTNNVQVVHLVTMRKDGSYIASLEAAMGGVKKNASYNTSSWLYKDNKLVLDSKIMVNDRSFDDMSSYTINRGGRLILATRYESSFFKNDC